MFSNDDINIAFSHMVRDYGKAVTRRLLAENVHPNWIRQSLEDAVHVATVALTERNTEAGAVFDQHQLVQIFRATIELEIEQTLEV